MDMDTDGFDDLAVWKTLVDNLPQCTVLESVEFPEYDDGWDDEDSFSYLHFVQTDLKDLMTINSLLKSHGHLASTVLRWLVNDRRISDRMVEYNTLRDRLTRREEEVTHKLDCIKKQLSVEESLRQHDKSTCDRATYLALLRQVEKLKRRKAIKEWQLQMYNREIRGFERAAGIKHADENEITDFLEAID